MSSWFFLDVLQRNSMILNYLMIPAIRWSPAIRCSTAILWSIGSMDFDNPKVYGDTFITDGLVRPNTPLSSEKISSETKLGHKLAVIFWGRYLYVHDIKGIQLKHYQCNKLLALDFLLAPSVYERVCLKFCFQIPHPYFALNWCSAHCELSPPYYTLNDGLGLNRFLAEGFSLISIMPFLHSSLPNFGWMVGLADSKAAWYDGWLIELLIKCLVRRGEDERKRKRRTALAK